MRGDLIMASLGIYLYSHARDSDISSRFADAFIALDFHGLSMDLGFRLVGTGDSVLAAFPEREAQA